jgi:hypothetical protein
MGSFLREHGKEVYPEIKATYIETMNKVSSVVNFLIDRVTIFPNASVA